MARPVMGVLLLCCCIAATGATCRRSAAASTPLSALSGTWRVTSVKVNQQGVSALTRDDPALMNLPLTIGPQRLELQGHACADPALTQEPRPVVALLQEIYASSPSDLGVDAAVERAPVWRISCRSGSFGPKLGADGWLLVIDSRTIAINWYDGALLILQRNEA